MMNVQIKPIEVRELIRTRRKELNLTQEDLAKKMNISISTIGRYESGRTELTDSVIEEFGKALVCDFKEMQRKEFVERIADQLVAERVAQERYVIPNSFISIALKEMGFPHKYEDGQWIITDEPMEQKHNIDNDTIKRYFKRIVNLMDIDFRYFLEEQENNGKEK